MKKKALFLVFFLTTTGIFSLDLTAEGGMERAIPDTDTLDITASDDGSGFLPATQFDPTWKASFYGELLSISDFTFTYERTPMFKDMLSALAAFSGSIFRVGLGGFWAFRDLDITNAEDADGGLAVQFGLFIPGAVFFEGTYMGSLTKDLTNDTRLILRTSAGFWIPHVRVGLHYISETFTTGKDEPIDENDSVATALTRYMLRLNIFDKPVAFTTQIDIGYMELSRTVTLGPDKRDPDTGQAISGGLRLDFNISRSVSWYLDIQGSMGIGGISSGALGAAAKTGLIFHITDD